MSLKRPDNRPQTGEKALRWAVSFLKLKGFDQEEAALEARLLLAKAWQKNSLQVLLEAKSELEQAVWEEFLSLLEKRGAYVPLHYLLGEKEFMSLPFKVSPAVLIPRWDTEVLVEEAIKILSNNAKPRVLDIGTGSGAIAVSIAYYLPQAEVVATDISAEALAVACENARILGVAERITFLKGDLYAPLTPEKEKFDLIVSNPPYLSAEEMQALPPDVRKEPSLALDGGKDGLFFYRAIAHRAKEFLAPGGHLLLEIGYRQAASVVKILQSKGLAPLRIVSDLEGRDRLVVY